MAIAWTRSARLSLRAISVGLRICCREFTIRKIIERRALIRWAFNLSRGEYCIDIIRIDNKGRDVGFAGSVWWGLVQCNTRHLPILLSRPGILVGVPMEGRLAARSIVIAILRRGCVVDGFKVRLLRFGSPSSPGVHVVKQRSRLRKRVSCMAKSRPQQWYGMV